MRKLEKCACITVTMPALKKEGKKISVENKKISFMHVITYAISQCVWELVTTPVHVSQSYRRGEWRIFFLFKHSKHSPKKQDMNQILQRITQHTNTHTDCFSVVLGMLGELIHIVDKCMVTGSVQYS